MLNKLFRDMPCCARFVITRILPPPLIWPSSSENTVFSNANDSVSFGRCGVSVKTKQMAKWFLDTKLYCSGERLTCAEKRIGQVYGVLHGILQRIF
jgi:hypothetical protein